ncbi:MULTISPECIES: thioredoxin domain-containing protein [unclassified Streptomyces]|uniref:DsbA family protein n=1 Tax=unclassified Streptomyces TaxID=2593676 RepID=UPI000373DDFF|nr:thioredoxin domain-containing protein [Streptomyces sp. HmicA12]
MKQQAVLTASVAVLGAGLVLSGCASTNSGQQASLHDDGATSAVREVPDAADLSGVSAEARGGTIVLGRSDAPHTVKVYEDPRCPYCKDFEQGGARALAGPVREGKVKVEYTIASFLDARLGGSGSANAANALRASVDAGQFPAFHAAVFADQPDDERQDAFTAPYLLKIADKVGKLRGAAFDSAISDGRYTSWVARAMKSFRDDGVQGTPTVRIDGKKADGGEAALYREASFAEVLRAAGIS